MKHKKATIYGALITFLIGLDLFSTIKAMRLEGIVESNAFFQFILDLKFFAWSWPVIAGLFTFIVLWRFPNWTAFETFLQLMILATIGALLNNFYIIITYEPYFLVVVP